MGNFGIELTAEFSNISSLRQEAKRATAAAFVHASMEKKKLEHLQGERRKVARRCARCVVVLTRDVRQNQD